MSASARVFCPDCGQSNDRDARFCQQCGRSLDDVRAAVDAANPSPFGVPVDSAGRLLDPEGRPISEAIGSEEERVLWKGRPSVLWSPRLALTQRYTITNHRMILTFGFIGRRTEEIELYRVTDVGVKQHPLERITRMGDVYVASADQSSPIKFLHNVAPPDHIKDIIRDASRVERQRRRVLLREEY